MRFEKPKTISECKKRATDCDFWVDHYANYRRSGKSRQFWTRERNRVLTALADLKGEPHET